MAISHAFSNAVADGTNTSIVRPSDWNSAHNQFLTVTGNTVGRSTFSGTNIVIGGGANITLSGVNATRFDISAAAGGGGSLNLSAGTTSNNLTAVTFSDSNGVSFGLNGSVVTATVQTNYLTTARASTDAIGLATAQSNVTWTVNSAGLSLDARGYAGTATGATSASITVNSNGVSVSIGPYLTTAMQSNAATISNIRVSGGTTSNLLSAITFGDANGITFGLNASTLTASHNGLTSQSNQNVTAGNGGFAFQTLSFSNANGVSFGTSAGSAITASHNAITTARASTDGIGLNTAQTNVTWTVNSSGLSLNAAGYAGTATTFNGANISGSITLNSAGLNLSLSGATAAPSPVNISAGTTSNNLATVVFSNSNGVSFGLNGSTITASVNAGAGGGIGAGVSTGGNTAGSTGTVTTGNVVFVGTNGLTLSQSTGGAGSAATITIRGPHTTLGEFVLDPLFNKGALGQTSQSSMAQNSLFVWPVLLDHPLTADHLKIPVAITNSSSAAASVQRGHTYLIGIYSRNATNATVLTQHYSTSYTMAASHNSNASWMISIITAIQNSTSYNTLSASSAGINLSASLHGQRELIVPFSSLLTPGEWWFALAGSSSSVGAAGNVLQMSNLGRHAAIAQNVRPGLSTNTTHPGWFQSAGFGVYSATTGAMPGGISFTQLNQPNIVMPIIFAGTGTV